MRPGAPTSAITRSAAWGALAILTGLNLLNYLDRYVMSAVLPPLQKELSLNDGDAGLAASAFMLGYFISAPFFGYLGDRLARKYLLLGAVVVWSLATAASGLAQNFAELFAIRVVVGVGEACFVTIGPSWISDAFAAVKRNTALTLFYVATPCGSAIGFIIGGIFEAHGDWRGAFIWAGLPGVVLAFALLCLREPRRGESDGIEGAGVPVARVGEVAGLLLNGRYNLVVWGYAAQTFAVGAFGLWGPAFLNRVHGMPLAHADAVFGPMLALTGLAATLLGGLFATRLRKRTRAGYAWVMAASLVFATPVCFFAVMVGDATLSLVGLGASMFFIFLPSGPIISEMYEIVPVHLRASAMAVCIFIIHLFGDFASPGAVGWLSDTLGHATGDPVYGLQKAVLILPVTLLIGAVLWGVLVPFAQKPHGVEA